MMWDFTIPEQRAQYRKECMAEAEQRRLVRLVAPPPVYRTLLARAGRSLILVGQRLATLETVPLAPRQTADQWV